VSQGLWQASGISTAIFEVGSSNQQSTGSKGDSGSSGSVHQHFF